MINIFRSSLVFVMLFITGCQLESPLAAPPILTRAGNETVNHVQVKLKNPASLQLEVTRLKNGKRFVTPLTDASQNHKIVLAGLKPNEWHSFQVMVGGQAITKPDSFRTAKIPSGIVPVEVRKNNENAFNGYLLTQRRLVKGNVYMLDADGEVVWYQNVPGQPKLSTLTKEGHVLVLYGNARHSNSAGDKIICYSLSGEIIYQIDLEKSNLIAHHEVLEVENDLAVLVYDTAMIDYQGEPLSVASSAIVRMNKRGETKWKWSIFNSKSPAKDPDVSGHFRDWGHTNAFSFDGDHLLVSQRDWNQIWKVDPKTAALEWIVGDQGTLSMSEGMNFSGQHAIHKTGMDAYLLFDNGRDQRKTRLLEFSIENSNVTPIMTIDLPDDLYADRMGNVTYLPNKNLLVCSPRSRSLVVINPEGTILFRATVGIPDPYRVEFVPSFYK